MTYHFVNQFKGIKLRSSSTGFLGKYAMLKRTFGKELLNTRISIRQKLEMLPQSKVNQNLILFYKISLVIGEGTF